MVKNYIINFFKNIVVVDFLTLNKKAVLLFLVLMNVALAFMVYLIIGISNPFSNVLTHLSPDAAGVFVATLGWGLDLILTGLMLPFLIRTWLAYTPLIIGIWTIEVPIYLSMYGTLAEETSAHLFGVLGFAILITIIYSILIRHLRKKYLTNTGRN
jgi:hypothetical protein